MRFRFEPVAKRESPPDDEFLVPDFTILFDHRERTAGWSFMGLRGNASQKYRRIVVKMREIHMVTADYTVEGYPLFIERKSHDDMIGSCTGGIVNLEKEFGRMKAIQDEVRPDGLKGYCCLIAETSLDRIQDELNDPIHGRKASLSGIIGVLASWPQRFGVQIHMAGTRQLAEELAYRTMEKYVGQAKKRNLPAT